MSTAPSSPPTTAKRPQTVIGLWPRKVDARALHDPDEDIRAATLGTILAHPEYATPLREPLAARLADANETEDNRILAAHALGHVSPLPVDDLVVGLARKQGQKVRAAAATALIADKGLAADAAQPLARCLLAGDATVRFQSVMALRGIGEPAVPHIARVVQDAEQFDITRMSGMDALGFIGGEAAAELALAERLAADSAPPVMVCARFAVASIKSAAVKPDGRGRDKELGKHAQPLVDMIEHEDPAVRLLAIERLGWLKDGAPSAGEALLRLLKEGSPAEREAAALGLARSRTPTEAALEPLTAALADPEPPVRRAACISLSAYGTDAKPALEKLLERAADPKETQEVRRAAGECAKLIVKAAKGPYWT